MPLDRAAQHLPIPIGGTAPAHAAHRRRAAHGAIRRRWRPLAVAFGCVSASVGAWLASGYSTPTFSLDAAGVHLDGSLLARPTLSPDSHRRLYAGAVALTLSRVSPDEVVASAVTMDAGAPSRGVCVMQAAGDRARERCTFVLGNRVLSARDSYNASVAAWTRVYSDGVVTRIDVPDGPLPVPLPIGR